MFITLYFQFVIFTLSLPGCFMRFHIYIGVVDKSDKRVEFIQIVKENDRILLRTINCLYINGHLQTQVIPDHVNDKHLGMFIFSTFN
jgi:hypothetical protein